MVMIGDFVEGVRGLFARIQTNSPVCAHIPGITTSFSFRTPSIAYVSPILPILLMLLRDHDTLSQRPRVQHGGCSHRCSGAAMVPK
jgi:hypothetical protein